MTHFKYKIQNKFKDKFKSLVRIKLSKTHQKYGLHTDRGEKQRWLKLSLCFLECVWFSRCTMNGCAELTSPTLFICFYTCTLQAFFKFLTQGQVHQAQGRFHGWVFFLLIFIYLIGNSKYLLAI